MLADPLPIRALQMSANTGGSTSTFASTDLTSGKSVRVFTGDLNGPDSIPGVRAVVTISHSTSNENSPVVTDRTLIRLDLTRVTPADPLVNPTMSCYVVLALPRAEFTAQEMADSFAFLAGLLFRGDDGGTTLQIGTLLRLLNGEP